MDSLGATFWTFRGSRDATDLLCGTPGGPRDPNGDPQAPQGTPRAPQGSPEGPKETQMTLKASQKTPK